MKIFVKKIEKTSPEKVKIQKDFITLMSRQGVILQSQYEPKKIPLGVAIKLPKYCYAEMIAHEDFVSRHNATFVSHLNIIDSDSMKQEWKVDVRGISITPIEIPANTNVAKFRVVLQKNAPLWAKIKWFFDRKIEIVFVDIL